MKCSTCQAKAAIELRRHNAAFCGPCFLTHLERQVQRTIESERMLHPGERVLVAVSGGKDSLCLWEILRRQGYETTGLDRKSTRLNSSHIQKSRMPSSA